MKKTSVISVLMAAVFAVSLYSCRPLYIPNAVHTPMLTEKNEVNGDILLGTSGLDVQAAYSPGKHWGIMIDGSYFDNTRKDTSLNHKHLFGEIGAGYHTKFGIGRFDVYGGGGYGHSYTTNHPDKPFGGTSEGNYVRFFIQPSIGLGTDIVDLNFAMRTVYVTFPDIHNPLINYGNNSSFFWEPAITLRIGYKWVKYFVQFGGSLLLGNNLKIENYPLIFTTGINLNFGKWKLKE